MKAEHLIPGPSDLVAERKHHPFSPSGLQNYEACPAYLSRQDGPVHERTTAGTKSHGVTETREDDNDLSDEDAVAAAECLDFYDRRKAMMLEKHNARLAEFGIIDLNVQLETIIDLVEAYLPIDDRVFPDGVVATTAGYVDRAIIAPCRTYAELMDWKFGMWPVEKADNNLQGIAYTLGLFRAYPTLQSIKFFFKQPHLEYVTSALFTRDQIPELYLRVQIVVARARQARELAAKGDWSMARPYIPVCLFCSHLANCEPVGIKMLNIAKKFSPLDFPDNITPSLLRNPAESAMIKKAAGLAAAWAKAVNSQLADQVLRGAVPAPEGYKVHSRANREIVDETKFKEVTLGFLTKEEYESTLSPSITAAETIISTNAPRLTKTAKVKEYKEALDKAKAVAKGDSYSFLKAIAKKEVTDQTENE